MIKFLRDLLLKWLLRGSGVVEYRIYNNNSLIYTSCDSVPSIVDNFSSMGNMPSEEFLATIRSIPIISLKKEGTRFFVDINMFSHDTELLYGYKEDQMESIIEKLKNI